MKSKNVLITISHLAVGGTEIQTLNLVKALTQCGYKVTVICFFRHIQLTVSQFKEAGANIYIVSPQYNDYNIKITYPTNFKLISFLYTHLKKIIHQEQIDIVHVQYMPPALSVVLVLHYLLHVKNIIVTSHTMADIYQNLRFIHFIQKHCVRAFTCITKKAEESFFNHSQLYSFDTILKKRNHFTIYNTLSPYIQIREQNKEWGHPTCIGVISRLEKIKGMDLVIPAFTEIRKHHPEIKLLIVGSGSLKELMLQQAHSLQVEKSITWIDRQAQYHLQTYYDQIDILLMPSRSEGFGLTAIEGMARGCVVVASNTGGLPEVVKDKEVGLLHAQENTEDMTEKICYLLENPQYMKTLSMNAVHYVEQFGYKKYTLLFNDMYKKITN
ncbi:glycosyltransferase family 4 protein [Bacteroides salyersiae]|jgi:glycosyltransferase, group 1 family|uniref:glycosyltransferase family 4 protein n=1 Tax=Bacteroides salyersiae TaxID=291644 RepID=UPI000326E3B9|nr:glycosyltransferase family 4 protein [Bacteroides salyersiae]EOA49358.1 hypothetical protein HMPREF1532_02998 [Bacteroides salyersiae WAL 10018 = DSM 18765 = JCM 12988]MBV4206017.1 glycosyltransferase family 4 protein [Bacteroides salyersiae]MCB6651172.1 glycosyltransferase family 4 protein [Bacteroides salyersiae]MCS3060707.1 glycosyltransferase family 4 protein [Bacteroides salyersiae]UBD64666.1 glycosyltransferase family 4 protein [Bacteroides salyersiae]